MSGADWSMGLLLAELSGLYQELNGGTTPAAARPELQYMDFTMWEREVLTPRRSKDCLDYWLGHLDGAPFALEIGQRTSRSPAAFHRSATMETSVPQMSSPERWRPPGG